MTDKCFVECPNCKNKFDSDKGFWWKADDDGDPTIESMVCPNCAASTEPQYTCEQCPMKAKCNDDEQCLLSTGWNYDDFKVVS